MQQKLIDLSTQYLQAGNAIHDAIRDIIKDEGGFINASNNKQVKTDINIFGTIYTDKYLRGSASEERWRPLKGSNILFYQTILSIAKSIDEYLVAGV